MSIEYAISWLFEHPNFITNTIGNMLGKDFLNDANNNNAAAQPNNKNTNNGNDDFALYNLIENISNNNNNNNQSMAQQESISNEFQHQLIDDLIYFIVIVQVLRIISIITPKDCLLISKLLYIIIIVKIKRK